MRSLRRLLGHAWFRAQGWQVRGSVSAPKAVLIAFPHTSNWDFPHLLAASWVFGIQLSWLGKSSLFRPPWGGMMRALGGIAVDRRAPQGLVDQVAAHFETVETLYVTVPPEGTRELTKTWRSGFYYMAIKAQVPLVLGLLDYTRRVADLGEVFTPTGDVAADMAYIRAYYEGAQGKYPALSGPIRLPQEDEPPTA